MNTRLTCNTPQTSYVGQAQNAKGKWIDKREFLEPEKAYNWLNFNTQQGKVRVVVKTVHVVLWKLSKHYPEALAEK